MLTELKKLRMKAMKEKDTVARYAYEVVITECDRKRGQVGRDVTESETIKILKREIGKYKETIFTPENRDDTLRSIGLLEVFVPKMIMDHEVRGLLTESGITFTNPKEAMSWMDEEGYKDRYKKGIVAEYVLRK